MFFSHNNVGGKPFQLNYANHYLYKKKNQIPV